jgi:hypothetical protein
MSKVLLKSIYIVKNVIPNTQNQIVKTDQIILGLKTTFCDFYSSVFLLDSLDLIEN